MPFHLVGPRRVHLIVKTCQAGDHLTCECLYPSRRRTPHGSTGHHCTTWGKVSVSPEDRGLINMNSQVQYGFWRQVQWRPLANIRCDLKLLRQNNLQSIIFTARGQNWLWNTAVKGTAGQTHEMREDGGLSRMAQLSSSPPSFCVICTGEMQILQLPLMCITPSKEKPLHTFCAFPREQPQLEQINFSNF